MKVHPEDTTIAQVSMQQATYDILLTRANELGFNSITSFLKTKIVNQNNSLKLISLKLGTHDAKISEMATAIGLSNFIKQRSRSSIKKRRIAK